MLSESLHCGITINSAEGRQSVYGISLTWISTFLWMGYFRDIIPYILLLLYFSQTSPSEDASEHKGASSPNVSKIIIVSLVQSPHLLSSVHTQLERRNFVLCLCLGYKFQTGISSAELGCLDTMRYHIPIFGLSTHLPVSVKRDYDDKPVLVFTERHELFLDA